MTHGSRFHLLRLAFLTGFAVVLVGLIAHRLASPTPAMAATDSAASGVHLVPNDRDQLVLYDTRSHRILTFAVVNGTDLRLRGWRNASDDPRLWDTSLLKGPFAGIENKNGATMEFLRPGKDPKVGSMMATQADQIDKYKVTIAGIAGEK